MKPNLEAFQAACPDVDPGLLAEHLSRLSDRYFNRFPEEALYEHVRGLSLVSAEHPVELKLTEGNDQGVECTVMAFDYAGVFSLMTGVLTGMGFNITTGDVFTYAPSTGKPQAQPRGGRRDLRRLAEDPLGRRRIVNHFSGTARSSRPFKDWAGEFRKKLEEIFALLEQGDEQGVETANNLVNEMVVGRLSKLESETPPVLYPTSINVDNETGPTTRLLIVSEDTPAFLYSFSHALSLHGIIIEGVQIRTPHGRIEDVIGVLDAGGQKIEDPVTLNRIKLSALLTKQFTHFLGRAPDPYRALRRFKDMIEDILRLPLKDKWLETLSDPHALKDLALLLGTSDFLWEDFIRLHYEALLPMLTPLLQGRRLSQSEETLQGRLAEALQGAEADEQRDRLNRFKDQEIFLIDLDHILNPESDFGTLSLRLTRLAEAVVNTAARLAYDNLVARFGHPETAAGTEASYAIFGLGKLGGVALGYASDIELLFVYSDNGWTRGEESIPNSEFFNRMAQAATQMIEAKQEGIFQVDMRLRPHGNSGPLAASQEAFCDYYGGTGAAHAFERLALVRMRAIGGSGPLGSRLERIRDEIVYSSRNIDIRQLRTLREKQLREKVGGGTRNAKFSPGGLVDLEYNIQILQVLHGHDFTQLRTPRLREALKELSNTGVLLSEEASQLLGAYDFFRQLINAMRMLRGSARDLVLPTEDSPEFSHLARRMGYGGGKSLGPSQQLRIDYETHTAQVRVFSERYFGKSALPGPVTGTVADLVLADLASKDLSEKIFSDAGFQEAERAFTNLRNLAGNGSRRRVFAKLALLAFDTLLQTPDPDMALNNWERFIGSLSSAEFHFRMLLDQPMRLEILLNIFAGSRFLADTLIRYPGLLDWVILPENLHWIRKRSALEEDLGPPPQNADKGSSWLNRLRRFRRKEILRIGTRDICLKAPTEEIMAELSILADVVTEAALNGIFATLQEDGAPQGGPEKPEEGFCILAFGKLGGNELNYSSDIDLLGIFSAPGGGETRDGADMAARKAYYSGVMERVGRDLSKHTDAGYAYRVDLRLRPYGRAGDLVTSLSGLLDYYQREASPWERQAALKIRPIAGNMDLGMRFLEALKPLFLERRDRGEVVQSIKTMREAAMKKNFRPGPPVFDVKNGKGGIRDVEFLVQGLQLIHAPDHPEILEANTLAALRALAGAGLLPEDAADQLSEDYLFLRRVEHSLQILEDRQIHALPRDKAEMKTLSKRVMGIEGTEAALLDALRNCCERVLDSHREYLEK